MSESMNAIRPCGGGQFRDLALGQFRRVSLEKIIFRAPKLGLIGGQVGEVRPPEARPPPVVEQ